MSNYDDIVIVDNSLYYRQVKEALRKDVVSVSSYNSLALRKCKEDELPKIYDGFVKWSAGGMVNQIHKALWFMYEDGKDWYKDVGVYILNNNAEDGDREHEFDWQTVNWIKYHDYGMTYRDCWGIDNKATGVLKIEKEEDIKRFLISGTIRGILDTHPHCCLKDTEYITYEWLNDSKDDE